METTLRKSGLILFMATMIFVNFSCVKQVDVYPRGYDGLDGRAFIRLNWFDKEPDYIDAGGVVPDNFGWDKYYATTSGNYIVKYEYDYTTSRGMVVTYPYEADIQVTVERGGRGGSNYNGTDGLDSYFDLELYPDGKFDYTVDKTKVGKEADDTLVNNTIDTLVTRKGAYTVTVIFKRFSPRERTIK